jgi:hypothetical protein
MAISAKGAEQGYAQMSEMANDDLEKYAKALDK